MSRIFDYLPFWHKVAAEPSRAMLHHIVIASTLDTGEKKDNPVSRDCP
jgi:hypothetical protein